MQSSYILRYQHIGNLYENNNSEKLIYCQV
jgi:hypothetical protein